MGQLAGSFGKNKTKLLCEERNLLTKYLSASQVVGPALMDMW
jgi:hypothetical protein